jgi:hypothetical protein
MMGPLTPSHLHGNQADLPQGCWIGNVLPALPKSTHKDDKTALAEIYNAEDRDHAGDHAERAVKWPKLVAKIAKDLDVLLTSYDCVGEH